jgi:hypothetical protein
MELQEIAYILNHATPRSLVLVDELGRATSTADGVAIAWAVSEHLIGLGAATLFATHFPQLAELTALYPNCRAWHLHVDTSRSRLDFRWRLRPGCNDAGHYGLLLAKSVGFPEDVLSQAGRVVAGAAGCGGGGAGYRGTVIRAVQATEAGYLGTALCFASARAGSCSAAAGHLAGAQSFKRSAWRVCFLSLLNLSCRVSSRPESHTAPTGECQR